MEKSGTQDALAADMDFNVGGDQNDFYSNDTPLVFDTPDQQASSQPASQPVSDFNSMSNTGGVDGFGGFGTANATPVQEPDHQPIQSDAIMNMQNLSLDAGHTTPTSNKVQELEAELEFVKAKAKEAIEEREEIIETLKEKAREKFEEQENEMEEIKTKAKEIIDSKQVEIEKLEEAIEQQKNKEEEASVSISNAGGGGVVSDEASVSEELKEKLIKEKLDELRSEHETEITELKTKVKARFDEKEEEIESIKEKARTKIEELIGESEQKDSQLTNLQQQLSSASASASSISEEHFAQKKLECEQAS
jgi:chromosome segregation ATPase